VLDGDNITVWDVPEDEDVETSDKDGEGAARDAAAGLGEKGHVVHVADLVESIWNDREPEIPGSEARRAVEVIKAIYLSSRRGGETVEFPLSYEDDGPGIDDRGMQWDW